ncbi:MAG: UDP-N-acetylglucosamine 1-carboxyvinyltransferase [Bdellovibrionales bacterium]|nr:UDP-N-acetylglucosamine 1-carboxyvinyltransferase [Bdellovibrionales bacterium]
MDKIVVQGGVKLNGSVAASGAKNSSLPILFASLLADGKHVFRNVPALKDIDSACTLLEHLGCTIERTPNTVIVNVKPAPSAEAHYDIVRKMRASVLVLGPLLARYGDAVVSLPGGCAIGARPIDQHLDGFKCLGAEIMLDAGYVRARGKKLVGANIVFDGVTVGGTENVMMGAVLADGVTTLENAAKEPEIVDLANYLNKMGAKVTGAGTSIIRIEGVSSLKAAEHDIIPDRIEAGTLLIAGAITGGEVTVTNCVPSHFEALTFKLRESGFKIDEGKNDITIRALRSWAGVDMATAPFPGFATDTQAQFMSLMCQAEGTSVISENIFENRFMHVPELTRMNADITPKTRVAIVRGRPGMLKGAPVMATDLRASASLVLAGLVAQGETTVSRIYHLDRGYERMEQKLSGLGAKIRRTD